MKIAAVADVKAHLSAYLKASEEGPVVVTLRGALGGESSFNDSQRQQRVDAVRPRSATPAWHALRELS